MNTIAVINPRAGRGRPEQIERLMRAHFSGENLSVRKTRYPGHAEEIARDAVLNGFGRIIMVGGDGTINEVLNGIVGSDITLAIIPSGTANDLASYYHIPRDIKTALDIIRAGKIRSVNALKVNHRYYLTIGGTGLAAEVVELANRLRAKIHIFSGIFNRLGSLIYIYGLINVLIKKSALARDVSIKSGDKAIRYNISSLLIGQQPRLGKHFQVFPEIGANYGRAGMQLITNHEKALVSLNSLLSAIHIIKKQSTCVKTASFSKAVIQFDRPTRFFGDGEILDQSDRFAVEIIPDAVKLIVPAEKGGEPC